MARDNEMLHRQSYTYSITAQAKTQMQTQEADSTSLRVYCSTRGKQSLGKSRHIFIIQVRVSQVKDGRQDQETGDKGL